MMETLKTRQSYPDLIRVYGQEVARRVLEVAAAGGHHLLLAGPAGSGKSLLAACLVGLLARCEAQEEPTERSPYRLDLPGSVLWLDDAAEIDPDVLDAVTASLERCELAAHGARATERPPAGYQLVATLRLCPCGQSGDPRHFCWCGPERRRAYLAGVEATLLEHCGLVVALEPIVAGSRTPGREHGEDTETVAARVTTVRRLQAERFPEPVPLPVNATLRGERLWEACRLGEAEDALLASFRERLGLSPRGEEHLLQVARTIADLAGVERVREEHLAEAGHYRRSSLTGPGTGGSPRDPSPADPDALQQRLEQLAEEIRQTETSWRAHLRELAEALPADPQVEAMREDRAPWTLTAYLRDRLLALAAGDGLIEAGDPVAVLEALARLTQDDLGAALLLEAGKLADGAELLGPDREP